VQTTKLISFVIPLILSGCVAAPLVITGVGAASVVTNEATGRTITDHTVSSVSGKDCRISRIGREDVCQDEVPQFKFKVTTTSVIPSSVEEIESKYR
jgi:hypothetical protein